MFWAVKSLLELIWGRSISHKRNVWLFRFVWNRAFQTQYFTVISPMQKDLLVLVWYVYAYCTYYVHIHLFFRVCTIFISHQIINIKNIPIIPIKASLSAAQFTISWLSRYVFPNQIPCAPGVMVTVTTHVMVIVTIRGLTRGPSWSETHEKNAGIQRIVTDHFESCCFKKHEAGIVCSLFVGLMVSFPQLACIYCLTFPNQNPEEFVLSSG